MSKQNLKKLKCLDQSSQNVTKTQNHHLTEQNSRIEQNFQNQLLCCMRENFCFTDSQYLDQSQSNTLKQENRQKYQLKLLLMRINQLKQQNQSLKQDIEYQYMHFSYIIELANKNITQYLSKGFQKILQKKIDIIQELSQRIKKFQQQEKNKSNLIIKTQQNFKKLQKNYQLLLDQNVSLKKRIVVFDQYIEKDINYKTATSQYSMGSFKMNKIASQKDLIDIKIKKNKSRNQRQNYQTSRSVQNQNMKSLDRIKLKIHKLKTQLLQDIKQ